MTAMARRPTTGVRPRHSRTCGTREARRCNCRPSYEAFVPAGASGRKVRRTFPDRGGGARVAARRHARDRARALPAAVRPDVRDAADELTAGMRSAASGTAAVTPTRRASPTGTPTLWPSMCCHGLARVASATSRSRRPGARRRDGRGRRQPRDDPQRAVAAPGRLSPRAGPRRSRRQPGGRCPIAGGARAARALRDARGGGALGRRGPDHDRASGPRRSTRACVAANSRR